ncbi:PREDICTED: LOW QUALITY PROTEIN: protocadherin alpha-C1-like [Haliaeetus leucocephalus]|uniref:LOW QUALITY PROTEIN: protocadherin alpha-C1-like n=1 Tax=Haliaeetus leucocephalus TaxID=52644 RepID=UPI00053CAE85|nr:PREDICTED: LOW QUALITY PROTEIN: protocadherin alpha-C1-like [Haliaeetus leucocephalus]
MLTAAWALGGGQVRYSVPEEAKAGTVVGRLAQDLGLEAGEPEARRLRLVAQGRRASVEVSGASGALVVSSRLDREELCGKSAPCALRLEVLVERPLRVFHVELEVTDINDNAPLFPVNEEAFTIAEMSLPGSRLPLERASDADRQSRSLCVAEGAGKSDLMVFSPNFPPPPGPTTENGSAGKGLSVSPLASGARGPCTSVGGSALATWARSEEELRSSSVRGQILFTVGLPSVYELFTCFFPGGDEGWGCRWVRGQRPPRRAHRFPSEEKPQGCRSVSSPERIQPLLLPPAEALCPNLTRLGAPPFWWAPLGFSQASIPSGTYPANLCRRHRSASAPPLMRCPRKRRLKIIADVDDDVETRAALRVVQPCAPQPRAAAAGAARRSGGAASPRTATGGAEGRRGEGAAAEPSAPAANFSPCRRCSPVPFASRWELAVFAEILDYVPAEPVCGELSRGGRMRVYLMIFCLICCTANGQVVYSIAEETERGASVGNIAKDLGIDAATLSARKFRMITGSSKQYFNINASTGALSVNEPIDREQLCELKSVCLLNYELVLENPLELYRMEFKVLDINDNSPSFPLSEYHINVPEFLSPGARFTLPNAQDLDEGTNSVQNYTLSPDEHFHLEMQTRGDGSKYPELVLKKALDREQQATHRLVLTAKDGGDPPMSSDVPVIVTVLDTNDNAPEFEHSVYRASILENSPSGTLVVQVHATDLDEGPNGEIRYSFSNTTSADLQQMFFIHPHTGEVTVNGVLAVQRPLLEMLIEARDNGAFGMSSTAKLLVEITDVNNHGPEITITSLSSPIPEDAVPGTVIALLSILDKDPGENGKVTCQIPDNLPFQLKPSLENYYSLVTSGLLDRELISGYNITITATDLGSPPITTQKTLWVQISDVNDNPPVFSADTCDVFVEENNPLGAFLYQVSASDPDMGENGRVSYMLRNSTVAGSTLASFLSVSLANGSIYAKRAFDFEQLRSFYFQVEAKDNGSPALSAAITVNVYISDQNDNAPAILYPTSQNGSVAVEVVPRLADEDYLVTKVVADDEDNAQNAWLSYHLAHSSDSTLFRLAPHSGELRTTRSMRSTDFLKHKVVVVVRDHGDPPLSSTVTVGILLADTLPQALPDFDDSREPPPLLNATNIYLIVSLACVSCIFAVFLLFLAILRLCHCQTCCCSGCCCPADEYEKYCYSVHMLPSSHLPPDMLEVTGVGKLTHTYLYRASVGLGPSNSSIPNGDAGNIPSGSRLQVPGPCIQVQQVQSDRLSAVLMLQQRSWGGDEGRWRCGSRTPPGSAARARRHRERGARLTEGPQHVGEDGAAGQGVRAPAGSGLRQAGGPPAGSGGGSRRQPCRCSLPRC